MDRFAESVRRLLAATSRTSGVEFHRAFARSVAEMLDVKFALVGSLDDASRCVNVLAFWDGADFVSPITYDLTGTPCEGVFRAGACHYPCEVQRLFPSDHMLVEMGIESYWGVPVRDRGGRTVGIVVALDVRAREPDPSAEAALELLADRVSVELERAAFERALSASEARYRQIVTCSQEGVWAIDLEARTTLANQPMARLLGVTVDEMLGRALWDFMDEQAAREARAYFERRELAGAERRALRLRHKSGRDVWTSVAASPLVDDHGSRVGMLALVADVTQAREADQKLQHAQKLESLGVLAGGIAHDFNNLLVGILGNAGLALMDLPPGSPTLVTVRDIEAAAVRAADLTRQLLAYSGKGRFVIERVCVNGVIEEMGHLLGAVISKKAKLEYRLEPTLPAVDADVTQIRQVIMNLITNASDALGEESGVVAVSTGLVHVDHEYLRAAYLDEGVAPGDFVRIEVSDDGAGMDAATRERIFDPFFTTKYAGRGLGLAAVLGILRGHRGAIRVESEPGRGARFAVLLPAVPQTCGSEACRSAPAPNLRRAGLVLVVDDEPAVRIVARRVLESHGYTVIEAVDGREGLRLFEERSAEITVVLLDLTMPHLSGDQVLREIRRMRPDARVVLSSGYSDSDLGARFASAGPTGFVRKPWTPKDLLSALANALDSTG